MSSSSKIKTAITSVFLCSIAGAVFAVVLAPFQSWDNLTRRSSDIILVRCVKTPNPYELDKNGVSVEFVDRLVSSEMEILSVLKGATNIGRVSVSSQYWPRQSECYLVLADFHDNYYQAFESYRVVPLGLNFPTNMLSGKSLDDQIKTALKYRLDMLNRTLQENQNEKHRLEQAFPK